MSERDSVGLSLTTDVLLPLLEIKGASLFEYYRNIYPAYFRSGDYFLDEYGDILRDKIMRFREAVYKLIINYLVESKDGVYIDRIDGIDYSRMIINNPIAYEIGLNTFQSKFSYILMQSAIEDDVPLLAQQEFYSPSSYVFFESLIYFQDAVHTNHKAIPIDSTVEFEGEDPVLPENVSPTDKISRCLERAARQPHNEP